MGITFSVALHAGGQPPPQHSTPSPPQPAPDAQTGTMVDGNGALQGQQIGVPVAGEPPKAGDTADLPHQVQQVLLQPGENLQAQVPAGLSSLYVPQPLTLATNALVIDMLCAHAEAAGSVLARDEITGYVALGERAVQAISQIRQREGDAEVSMPQRLQMENGILLSAQLEVMRAISWYVVACAAQQDANRQACGVESQIGGKVITDLTIAGSYVVKDPHNAIYDFMNHYPGVYARISTHFNERSDSALLAYGHADQRGIEDYQNRLPGEGGTILFDRLKDGEIFFKFEHDGVPTLASARALERGQGGATDLEVAYRVGSHTLSFLWTLMYASPGVERKEHVYKGLLEAQVHRPFLELVRNAQALGMLEQGASEAQHARQSKAQGLPHLERTLAQLEAKLGDQALTEELAALRLSLAGLKETIGQAKLILGAQSDHLGIIRRGAETHADLNPPRAHLQHAQQLFLQLAGDAAQGQASQSSGLYEEAAQDWAVHGITIAGHAFAGSSTDNGIVSVEGRASTLEQARSALLEVCGGNAVAADWISRFARQAQAAPLMDFLRQESLGSVGSGLELIGGKGRFAIEAADGGVELHWNFAYQQVGEARLEVRQGDGPLQTMHDRASLRASMSLRFEGLDQFAAADVPMPTISQPLTYSAENFQLAVGSGFEIVDFEGDESSGTEIPDAVPAATVVQDSRA